MITQPLQEPVNLAEAKQHLRVDISDDDDLITGHILAARKYCEEYQGRTYAQQELELTLDDWPHGWPHGGKKTIEIPRPPLINVESIKYYGTDNTEYVWDPALYFADVDGEPGRICPAYAQYYPVLQLRPISGIKIRYLAGYLPIVTTDTIQSGTDPAPVAGTVKNADGSISVTVLNADGSATVTKTDYCGNVPKLVKQAMLLLIGVWYKNREAVISERGVVPAEIEFTVRALLDLDRVVPI